MSLAALTHTTFSPLANVQSKVQAVSSEFQKLGSDLTTGDLTKAQTDFVASSQSFVAGQQASNLSAAQAFDTLGQSLQSGDLSVAQQSFAKTWPGAFGPDALSNLPLPHGPSSSQAMVSGVNNAIMSDLVQLGRTLQAGNLSAAQQAFTTLQQDWQQVGGDGSGASTANISGNTVRTKLDVKV